MTSNTTINYQGIRFEADYIAHTPGPWFVEVPDIKKQRVDISTKASCPTTGNVSWSGLARAYGCEDDRKSGTEAMIANARLIASAPELLEALTYIEGLAMADDVRDLPNIAQIARAVIAKATGGAQ